MDSQLEVAWPLLTKHELLGTFYVITDDGAGVGWRANLEPWRSVAAARHEVGSHSVTHPCSETAGWVKHGVERMTLDEIEADLVESERRLREGVPEHTGGRSFAYPCHQEHVGVGASRQSYVPVVARHFVAARSAGPRPNDPRGVDLHAIWSFSVARCSAAELIGLCEWAALEGAWTVLTFHGVNEGHLPVADSDLRLLCAHLAKHRDRIWTAPVVAVAEQVARWRGTRAVTTTT